MSRFFAASSSSDDDDDSLNSSSSFDSSASSDSDDQSSIAEVAGPKKTGASKWMKSAQPDSDEDSDDDDDQKKVVKSQRDKRFDEMREMVEKMQNGLKIKDWVSVQTEYDKLQKGLAKADAIIKREGVPRFYIRSFCALEDSLQAFSQDKEGIKKMNPSTAKAYNTLKQKLKKEQKLREADIEKFRANPVDELDSADEADELAEQKAAQMSAPRKVTIKEPEESDDDFVEVGKKGKAMHTSDVNVFDKLEAVLDARGKKNTDKLAQIETLVGLLKHVKTPFQHVCVLNALIPTRFDYVPPVSGCMATEMWQSALNEIKSLYDLLRDYPNIIITTSDIDDEETNNSKDKKFANGEQVYIRGSIASYVDRLDDEFFKSLQNMDHYSTEYIDRLRDETSLYSIIVRAQKYAEANNAQQDSLDLMLMRRVEHLYYKPDSLVQKIEEAVINEYPDLVNDSKSATEDLVGQFCTKLYKTQIDRIRTRALLYHVYHLALHDHFHDAKNTILMSHLQETISQTDIATQTLFNRTLVQIGLCAFRLGYFRDSHNILQEISSSAKTKELLAQGLSTQKFSERTPEQEKADKSRQLPFHMHVNLELLESVYLVSAMLLEIPNIALHIHDSRRKMISKTFRRMLEFSERQLFTGPPENTRDHIMAASRAMAAGNWQDATKYINAVKVWNLLPNAEQVKEKLACAIKEETLKTYIFTYARFYDSLGIKSLSSMFQLSEDVVKNLVSKMIYQDHLNARLDANEEHVLLDGSAGGVSVTRMEYLAGYFTEKLGALSDVTDKIAEVKNLSSGEVQDKLRRGHRKNAPQKN